MAIMPVNTEKTDVPQPWQDGPGKQTLRESRRSDFEGGWRRERGSVGWLRSGRTTPRRRSRRGRWQESGRGGKALAPLDHVAIGGRDAGDGFLVRRLGGRTQAAIAGMIAEIRAAEMEAHAGREVAQGQQGLAVSC